MYRSLCVKRSVAKGALLRLYPNLADRNQQRKLAECERYSAKCRTCHKEAAPPGRPPRECLQRCCTDCILALCHVAFPAVKNALCSFSAARSGVPRLLLETHEAVLFLLRRGVAGLFLRPGIRVLHPGGKMDRADEAADLGA
jgi:hypothetical protein